MNAILHLMGDIEVKELLQCYDLIVEKMENDKKAHQRKGAAMSLSHSKSMSWLKNSNYPRKLRKDKEREASHSMLKCDVTDHCKCW